MKQTAVDFLYEFVQLKLTNEQQAQFEGLFQQAKTMEKEQIIKAVYHTCSAMSHSDLPCGEEYYNKTFKSE